MRPSPEQIKERLEEILTSKLPDDLGLSPEEGEELLRKLMERLIELVGESEEPLRELRRLVDPQWVVLAGGRGTRIDPEGILNKTLDIWIGESNPLKMVLRNLPGSRIPIVVVNFQMHRRIKSEGVEKLLGRKAHVVVQPVPDGTGGALKAARPLLERSTAELVGVAFGDEPFLDRSLYLRVLFDHIIKGADITLCGKIPETVVDKGGLFFDEQGRLMGTNCLLYTSPSPRDRG